MGNLFNETEVLTVTTDSGGTATAATSGTIYNGAIYAYDVDFGTADGTAVLTFSSVGGAADQTNRTIIVSAAGNTDGIYFPRKPSVKSTDGTAGAGEEMIPLAGRKWSVTVATAGNSKTILVKLIMLQ